MLARDLFCILHLDQAFLGLQVSLQSVSAIQTGTSLVPVPEFRLTFDRVHFLLFALL